VDRWLLIPPLRMFMEALFAKILKSEIYAYPCAHVIFCNKMTTTDTKQRVQSLLTC